MPEKPYDLLIFIGRFQPFHNSHYAVLQSALQRAKHVLILVGSANRVRSPKNPFTAREREVMIRATFPEADDRLRITSIKDYPYMEDLWLRGVQDAVDLAAREVGAEHVGIIGHTKDESSYYLKAFPQWEQIDVPNFEGRSATELRDLILSPNGPGTDLVLESALPAPCLHFVREFQRLPQFKTLVREYQFIQNYRNQYAACPYPPTFVTVDAVVVHSGHILLVERRAMPGEGLLALPGGFLGQDERLLDAAIRELKEETRLKLPVPVLKGSLRGSRVFDDPDRSQRGRTITHAFHFEFPTGPLPAVKGGDDARRAKWVSLSDFYALDGQMFEDHWHIGTSFLGGV
jgi:bifunctional NMN adenylyltransferase/nudix hydrolase